MTPRERRRKRKQTQHPVKRVLLLGGVLTASALAVAALGVVGYVMAVAADAPTITHLQPQLPGKETQLFAGNGQLLGSIASAVVRDPLSQGQQPLLMRRATVAIEDRRFWQHGGVDYEGLVRAAVKDIIKGGGIQGGSTLTMQLVTNVYLPHDVSDEHNLRYKIIQAKLANELESRRSKNWILTQYLNDVPYTTVNGQNAIGIAAASRMLFDKPVDDLDLAQIALLAGLPQAPTSYNPFIHRKLATWRRGLVLAAMVRAGYITQAAANRANASTLQLVANDPSDTIEQPYVFSFAQQQLSTDLDQELGQAAAEKVIDQGGLKVYTTINLRDQAYAEQAIQAHEGEPGDPAASLVSIDPTNGHILALQNSTKYGDGPGQTEFNYATQAARQTGSAFKAFVLMTLIHDDDGNPNETFYNSAPLPAGWLPSDPSWAVQNASESDAQGVISVTEATTLSVNAVYAQLGVDLGMTNVSAMANDMGITAKLISNPAEAIGGLKYGVSALQMSDAYATIANGGDHIAPTIISKVVLPDGKTYDFGDPAKTPVFTQGEAYAATQVLKTVIQYGTGTAANYGCPAAGKTGTTNDYTDAWFVGYTPQLSTAVWVGYPRADTYMEDVNGLGPGYGGTLAAPIWHDFMEKASDGYCGDFAPPDQYWYGEPYFGKHTAVPPVPTMTSTTTTSTTSTTGAGGLTGATQTNTAATTTPAPAPITTAPIYGTPPAQGGGQTGAGGGNGLTP